MSGAKKEPLKNEDVTVPQMATVDGREKARKQSQAIGLDGVRQLALLAAGAAVDVKAEDARVLDVHQLVSYTDFLVICTGRNTRLTRRIAEEINLRLKSEKGLLPVGSEGSADGEWLLLDYLDFVVHVFTPEARDFYRLESLWKQATVEDVG